MLRRFLNGLAGIIYPKVCLVCKKKLGEEAGAGDFVCARCWANIKRNTPPFCHGCGRSLKGRNLAKNICPACIKTPLYFDRAFSPCVYDGALKELIHEFKYKGKDYLGPILSRLMVEFIKEYNLPVDWLDAIIPIPLHKARLREREFNQAEILSRHIAEAFGKSLLTAALSRPRQTKTQTDLETEQRFLNVRGSFLVSGRAGIKGKNLLVVDDVLTTGATSSEAAYALKEAGANIVFVLTLAS